LRRYVFIAVGGVAGAIARYIVKNTEIYNYKGQVPLNTLTINIVGSFLLALLLTLALQIKNFDEDLRVGIGTGFLGAFTTFSTMCKEAVLIIKAGYYFSAITYLSLSLFLGIAAAYLGGVISRNLYKALWLNKSSSAISESGVSKAEEENK
jgi:fluoride exporter